MRLRGSVIEQIVVGMLVVIATAGCSLVVETVSYRPRQDVTAPDGPVVDGEEDRGGDDHMDLLDVRDAGHDTWAMDSRPDATMDAQADTTTDASRDASDGSADARDGETGGGCVGGGGGSVGCDAGGVDAGSCSSNRDCTSYQYCAFPVGTCSGMGMCAPRPDVCPRELVCGCDGRTYVNRCEVANAGVSIRLLDACPCSSNEDCAHDQYCRFLSGCGGGGACMPRPSTCPDIDDPVCGCDGRTYANSCEAARAGVSVRSRGPCSSTDAGVVDGGGSSCRSNSDCMFGGYCLSTSCDGTGMCWWPSRICGKVSILVCGCDGRTYDICDSPPSVNIRFAGACGRM